jgi:hypothetical protein
MNLFQSMRLLMAVATFTLAIAAPAQAFPSLAGSWSFTAYLDPSRSVGASQCIVFTETGSIAGIHTSGTWYSPTFAGWSGNWTQLEDHINWYGFTDTGVATSYTGSLINSHHFGGFNFDSSYVSSGTVLTSSHGSFTMTRVPSCSAALRGGERDPNLGR